MMLRRQYRAHVLDSLLLLLLWSFIVPSEAQEVGLRAPLRLVDVLNPHLRRRTNRSHRTAIPQYSNSDDVQELYFTQRLDHFHPEDYFRTFQQRYFYSNRFVRNDHNSSSDQGIRQLIFLCVGGEGPSLDASVLIDSVHCSGDMLESARRLFEEYNDLRIVLLALEHRYYGESYPQWEGAESPVTDDHLIYLSSRQAAADLAHFVQTLFSQHDATVILFGGSYPGMLASFARIKYPHLFYGAVSNSAPVQAVLDFQAYHAHVAYDLRQIDPLCHDIVKEGHAALVQQVQPDSGVDLTTLAQQFSLCYPETVLSSIENQQMWLGDGVLYLGAQENDPSCAEPGCNLQKKCDILMEQWSNERQQANATNATAAVAALAYLVKQQQQQQGNADENTCVYIDWEETLAYITDPERGQEGGLRSWLWQTCTEFGFYQTCESTAACPFGVSYHPLSQDLIVCYDAFNRSDVAAAVQATNEWSGGWHAITERILSVTGSVDPWSEMARHSYSVPGASHHFWTHPIRETDDDAIVAAREYIYQTVRDWIFTAELRDNGPVQEER